MVLLAANLSAAARTQDTVRLFILILVQMTVTQGHRGARKQKLQHQFSINVLSLDGIWRAVETCWCDEPHCHLMIFFFFFFVQ